MAAAGQGALTLAHMAAHIMEAQVGALRRAAEQSIVAYEMMHWSGWVPRRLLPRWHG